MRWVPLVLLLSACQHTPEPALNGCDWTEEITYSRGADIGRIAGSELARDLDIYNATRRCLCSTEKPEDCAPK